MVMIELMLTDDYSELREFFIENELEVKDDEPVSTDPVKCWRMADGEKLVGGIVLAKREGEFIIDGIAVDAAYRKRKLGTKLLEAVVEEVRKAAGYRIFLVARAPGFFRAYGFVTVPKESAPHFFECLTCPQNGVSCHPEIMRLEMGRGA